MNTKNKNRLRIFPIVVIAIIVVVVVAIIKYIPNFKGFEIGIFNNKEGEVTTITESSIQKVFEISELQTSNCMYNSIVEVKNEGETKTKYYVAYKGTVVTGINFKDINISVDNDAKKIQLDIPDVVIQDTLVASDSLDFIFTDKKYDKSSVIQEAYGKCQDDLKEKSENDEELLNIAQENAKQVVTALVSPWVEQIDPEYVLEVN